MAAARGQIEEQAGGRAAGICRRAGHHRGPTADRRLRLRVHARRQPADVDESVEAVARRDRGGGGMGPA